MSELRNVTDKTTITIDSYNRCVAQFIKEHMNLGLYEPFFQEFSDLLKEGATILDLGCGPGNVGKFLVNQNKGYKITGIDLSVEMLKAARQNVPNAEFIHGDIRHLTLGEKFDAVIISFCIIHLTNDETVELFQKIHELLEENGLMYVSFMSGGTPGFDKVSFSRSCMFFNYYSPEEVVKLLESMGYIIKAKHFREYHWNKDQVNQDVILIAGK